MYRIINYRTSLMSSNARRKIAIDNCWWSKYFVIMGGEWISEKNVLLHRVKRIVHRCGVRSQRYFCLAKNYYCVVFMKKIVQNNMRENPLIVYNVIYVTKQMIGNSNKFVLRISSRKGQSANEHERWSIRDHDIIKHYDYWQCVTPFKKEDGDIICFTVDLQ